VGHTWLIKVCQPEKPCRENRGLWFDCIISIFDITHFSSKLSQAYRGWVMTVRSKLMQVGLATTKQEFLKECEVAPGISQNEFAHLYPGDTVTN